MPYGKLNNRNFYNYNISNYSLSQNLDIHKHNLCLNLLRECLNQLDIYMNVLLLYLYLEITNYSFLLIVLALFNSKQIKT